MNDATNTHAISADAPSVSVDRRRTLTASFIAAFLGSVLIYGVGLAQPNALHNAAHDTRHVMAFPCH